MLYIYPVAYPGCRRCPGTCSCVPKVRIRAASIFKGYMHMRTLRRMRTFSRYFRFSIEASKASNCRNITARVASNVFRPVRAGALRRHLSSFAIKDCSLARALYALLCSTYRNIISGINQFPCRAQKEYARVGPGLATPLYIPAQFC